MLSIKRGHEVSFLIVWCLVIVVRFMGFGGTKKWGWL